VAGANANALGGAIGQGQGPGMGGPGRGQGGVAPEDNAQKTGFQSQRSRSALTAGRMLMKFKTTENAESGKNTTEHNAAVELVRQGASEAILKENVPPSYHEAIKSYFDQLKKR